MSTTVDQRVVSMQFDNQHFEKNVSTTMSTLDKLKQSLNFKGVEKGLNSVTDGSSKTAKSMEELEYASYKAGFRWSDVLHKMSSTAEWRMAQNAIIGVENAIKNLASSILGLPSIKAGFSEYETQMGAIQTILANTESKGTTLDDVNGALDELNAYADKTIYNFTEMTKNIGTFTAAGVDLDTSVSAIKGIANLAAVSGSTSQQASTAMYQLSQAMASGTVKLMDWNSVVNAGMGGQVFQDALKETAKVHGVAIDDIIAKQGSFRESLSEGWLTTEILTETLSKFTGDLSKEQLKSMGYTDEQIEGIIKLGNTANDAATKVKTFTQLFDTLKEAAQSGWSQTWEIIIGDFEEAKEFLTEISNVFGDMINNSSAARNELLSDWKTLGGRDDLIQSLRNAFEGLMNIIKPIGDAWRNVFPATTAKQLVNFTKGLKNLTQGFKEFGEKYGTRLERTLTGVFAVLKIGVEIIKAVFKALGLVFGVTDDLIGGVLGITAIIGDLLAKFSEVILSSGIISATFKLIGTAAKILIKAISGIIEGIAKAFKVKPLTSFQSILSKVADWFNNLSDSAEGLGSKLGGALSSAGEAISNSPIFKFVKTVVEAIGTLFKKIGSAFSGFFNNTLDWIGQSNLGDLVNFINNLLTGGLAVGLIKLIDSFDNVVSGAGSIKDSIAGLVDAFKDMISPLTDCLKSLQNQVKANIIKTIANALLTLAAALLIISFIPKDKLYDALIAIGALFAGLMGAMTMANKGFSKIVSLGKTFKDIKATLQYQGMITKIATALLIMAIALKVLSTMEWDEIERGLVAMGGCLICLVGAMYVLSKIKGTNKMATEGSKQLTKLAWVLILMAVPLKLLGNLSWDEIKRGLTAMTIALGVMVGVLFAMSKIRVTIKDGEKNASSMAKGAKYLLIMAAALLLVSIPIKTLGNMPWEKWGRGLGGITIVLGVMVGAIAVMSKVKANGTALKGASSMVIMASAFLVMTGPLMLLSLLNWEALARGLTGLVGILGVMLAAQVLLNKFGSTSVKGASGLVILSSAFLIMVAPLMVLSSLNWGDLARGVVGLIAVLGTMLGAQVLLNNFGSTSVKGASGLVIMSSALLMITGPLVVLSMFSWEALARAAVGVVGVLGILVGAQVLLSKFGSGSVKGAASLLLMVGAITLLVPALALLGSIPLLTLAKGLLTVTIALAAFVGAAALITYLGLTPALVALGQAMGLLGLGMLAMSAASILFGAGLVAISIGLTALVGAAEIIVGSLGVLCNVIVSLLSSLITGLLKGIAEGIVAFCEVIIQGAPAIGEAIVTVCLAVLDMLVTVVPALAEALFKILVGVLEYCAVYIGPLCEALLDIVIGIINALAEKIGPLVDAVVDLLFSFIQAVITSLANMQSTDGLAEALLSCSMLTAIVAELAAIAVLTPFAMLGVVGLSAVVAELALVLAAIGALAQIPGLQWIISEGGNFLQTVGTAIGQFVGGIIGGIGQGISGSLPQIGTDLSTFMQNLQPFIDGAKLIDESVVEGVKGLVGVIAAITGTSLLESITSWLMGESSIAAFAEDLPTLGRGLKAFSDSTAGIVPENIIAASNAAKALAEMASIIPNEGGVIAWFAGDNSLSKFANDIGELGKGLQLFSIYTMGIVPENVVAAANAAKSLAEMASVIPNEGGVVAWFAGDNSIASFASELGLLGSGIAQFAFAVAGIPAESVVAAAQAGKALVDMVSAIPKEGGIAAWFSGEQNILGFALELPALGRGLSGFASAVDGINPEAVVAAAQAGAALSDMVSAIPKEGGIAAWFSGDVNMADFAAKLPTLGSGIAGFAKNVGNINPENVSAAAQAGKALAEMTDTLPSNVDKIEKFGKKLKDFGTKLKEFFNQMSGVSSSTISGAKTAIEEIKKITDIDDGKIKAVSKAIDNFADSVKDMAKNAKSDLKNAGKDAMDAFIKGINDKLSDAKKACQKIIDGCVDKLEDSAKFESAGKEVVEGFAKGISENTYKAEAKAEAMAKKAKEAAEKALGIESPSKELYKDGRYAVLGFANALTDYSDLAYDAGFGMANYARTGIGSAIAKISDAIYSDIDTQPTIRPVLDLSDIRSGANAIGSIFGSGGSVGVMANVNTVSSLMRGYNQNGASYEVISAIDKLRKDLSNVGNTTYNVNGITYDDGSNISEAVRSLVRAARVERRI